MKYIVSILISMFLFTQVEAQISVKYSVGYGTYSMSDMKGHLSNIRSEILQIVPGLEIATTDNFPGYVTQSFDVGYRMQKHEFGITGSYLNTAGKISYADYSGKISSEIKVSGYRGGVFYRNYFYKFDISKKQNLLFYGEISPGIIFSKVKIDQEVSPENDMLKLEKSASYNNTSLCLLPQVGVKYSLFSHVGLSLSVGYEINFGSKIPDIERKVDWSGVRFNGGIGYNF